MFWWHCNEVFQGIKQGIDKSSSKFKPSDRVNAAGFGLVRPWSLFTSRDRRRSYSSTVMKKKWRSVSPCRSPATNKL